MRVLLDESLPRQLARELSRYEFRTVQQQGWSGLENGVLFRRAAESEFPVFLTADQEPYVSLHFLGADHYAR